MQKRIRQKKVKLKMKKNLNKFFKVALFATLKRYIAVNSQNSLNRKCVENEKYKIGNRI